MPRIRIGTTSASLLLFMAVTVGGASAQTATAGSPGKPLPLLQIVHQKSKAKLRSHPMMAVKFAKKTHRKRRIAKHILAKTRKAVVPAPRAPAPAATAALPENIWPAAGAATPGGMAALAPQPAPASVSTEPVVDTDPDEIVTNGHIVQAASPDEVNPADLAADNPQKAAKAAVAHNPVAPAPVVHAMIVKPTTPAAQNPTPVGSASWIAHVLAALGGAIAAGAVAWFLIGPAPQRNYG